MFNARQLLDQLVQTAQGMATPPANTTSPRQNAGIGGMLNNPAVTGALSGVGGGLLAGLLFGNKNVRKVGGNLATVGGAAALGVIATKAYRNWQANKQQSNSVPAQNAQQQSPQSALDFDNLPAANQEEHSRAMLTAMIAAAKADGHFDERERQIIREQTEKIGDAETTAWVQEEIYKPLDVNQIAALATSPELAAEIYLASLIVSDEQNEREKIYLNSLAEKLKLEPQLRTEIEQQLSQSGL
ncbi:MAG: tellurite resistance TerB family protein [Syntrophobacterales bacterium]|jgi:uncharacterized membrane protein YebE (DUF533 family)|nr:tellurite resistance TerB family protein [Syntrophobacterales bacterium]